MSATALHLLAVALGGAIGGIARVWLAGVVTRQFGERFPWGTLVVNVSGSGLIGVAAAIALGDGFAMASPPASPSAWALLVIGVLGSYTTVSSFSFQTLALLQAGEPLRAGANVAASVFLCLAAAALSWLWAGWMVSA